MGISLASLSRRQQQQSTTTTTETLTHLTKFDHVQLAISYIGVVLANQLADLMSRKLYFNNLQCFL